MQFVFPFQPRDMPAARASQLPWMISILSIPLGKYSALQQGMCGGGGRVFLACWVKCGQRGQSWDREQQCIWEGRRCGGSARLAGQPGIEAPAPPQGCGLTVCYDLSTVWSLRDLLLGWLPGISPDPSSSLALFKRQLSLSALQILQIVPL